MKSVEKMEFEVLLKHRKPRLRVLLSFTNYNWDESIFIYLIWYMSAWKIEFYDSEFCDCFSSAVQVPLQKFMARKVAIILEFSNYLKA